MRSSDAPRRSMSSSLPSTSVTGRLPRSAASACRLKAKSSSSAQLRFERQAAGHAAPQRPPFGAHLAVLVVLHARLEQGPQLLDAPLVERVAEAGAQAVAGQVEPRALVLDRAAPAFRARHQGVEQAAQQRRGPAFARAQQVFQASAQLAALPSARPVSSGRRRCVRSCRLPRPDSRAGLRPARRHRRRLAIATQLEFQQPAPAAVFGHAMHFERTDFAQRRDQLHGDLGALCRTLRRAARVAIGGRRTTSASWRSTSSPACGAAPASAIVETR